MLLERGARVVDFVGRVLRVHFVFGAALLYSIGYEDFRRSSFSTLTLTGVRGSTVCQSRVLPHRCAPCTKIKCFAFLR
jgi:hypothetical protein